MPFSLSSAAISPSSLPPSMNLAVHPPDGLDFLFRSGHEDYSVCLQALALTPLKNALRLAILVDAHAAQPVARHAALAKAALDKPALAGKHLFREFAAVIGGHIPFEALDHRRYRAAVVDELIHAVVDLDPGSSAGEFEGCGLVLILKPAPSAYVVDKDRIETGIRALRVCQHLLHAGPVLVSQAASRLVRIGGDELHVAIGGVALDDRHLVLGRILLEVSRHSEVGDGTPSRLRLFGIRIRLGMGLVGHLGLIFGVVPPGGAAATKSQAFALRLSTARPGIARHGTRKFSAHSWLAWGRSGRGSTMNLWSEFGRRSACGLLGRSRLSAGVFFSPVAGAGAFVRSAAACCGAGGMALASGRFTFVLFGHVAFQTLGDAG